MTSEAIVTVKTRRELGIPSKAAADMLNEMQIDVRDSKSGVNSTLKCDEGVYTGKYTVNRDKVEIVIYEPNGVYVGYSFSKDNLKLLTITRRPDIGDRLFLTFEEGKRHICVNYGGDGPFEIITYASKLQNELSSGGSLCIDYLIELHGLRIEKTEINLSIKLI